MRDVLLLVCVLLAFLLGCLPMRRLDRFLNERSAGAEEEIKPEGANEAEAPGAPGALAPRAGAGISAARLAGTRPLRHRI